MPGFLQQNCSKLQIGLTFYIQTSKINHTQINVFFLMGKDFALGGEVLVFCLYKPCRLKPFKAVGNKDIIKRITTA